MASIPEGDSTGPDTQVPDAALAQRVANMELELVEMRAQIDALRDIRAATAPPPQAAQPAPGTIAQPARPLQNVPVAPAVKLAPAKDQRSLEDRLGGQVLSKLGVLLLLVGAAWFLKWAFDNRWIGPAGRVIVGVVAGVAVVIWSEHFRRQKMFAFSYALKAVGSGVLYLSLWASFHLYHLVPAPVAFGAMVAVAVWNAIMAWSQDAMLLAGYAMLGAYITPVLLSTGENHEAFLFSYLFLIAASLVALVRLKPWPQLLLFSLPATIVFFVGWYSDYFATSSASETAAFALLLWAVFASVPLIVEDASPISNVLVPIVAAAFGALSIYSILADSGKNTWEAWVALGFAAVYLALAQLRRERVSAGIHLALAVVFLTITIPLKATGRGITIGWLVEGVALLWVCTLPTAQPRAGLLLRWLGWIALLLGVGGALIEPWFVGGQQTAFLNLEFTTSLVAMIALAAALYLTRKFVLPGTENRWEQIVSVAALFLMNILLLTAMHREIFRAYNVASWDGATPAHELADFCFSGWMMVQAAALLAYGFLKREPVARWMGLVLLIITVLKAFLYDMRTLGMGYRALSYLALGVMLMAVSFAYQKDWLGLRAANHEGEA